MVPSLREGCWWGMLGKGTGRERREGGKEEEEGVKGVSVEERGREGGKYRWEGGREGSRVWRGEEEGEGREGSGHRGDGGREKRKGRTGLEKEREGKELRDLFFLFFFPFIDLQLDNTSSVPAQNLKGIFSYKQEQLVKNECKLKKINT